MSFNFNSINDYLIQANEARKAIIARCREVGYIVPTDEMRKNAGLKIISLSEIPNWLYRKHEAILYATTPPNTSVIFLDKSLKDDIPDLEIYWDYGHDKTTYVKISEINDTVIKYTYPKAGQYTIGLFSPSKLDKVSSYAFVNNNYVQSIRLTPVIETIDTWSFFRARNLTEIDLSACIHLKEIKGDSFYTTALKYFIVPASVLKIHGSDTFQQRFESFSFIEPTDNIERRLIGTWIFNFNDTRLSGPNSWIKIPKQYTFWNSNETIQLTYKNINSFINTWNPFSRSCDRFEIDPSDPNIMNDANGNLYVKDPDGNPSIMIYATSYFDGDLIPETVKQISYAAFMNLYAYWNTPKHINFHANIEYISPGFEYWGHRNFIITVDKDNRYYKTGPNGELLTYSTLDKVSSGQPDVVVYAPRLVQSTYVFPDNFSSLTDFKNARLNISSLVNRNSLIDYIQLNKDFPRLTNESNVGPFGYNPAHGFNVPADCTNYSVYDGCLYMKSANGKNPYEVLLGVPKQKVSVDIHPQCTQTYMSSLAQCKNLTGTLNLKNITQTSYAFCKGLNIEKIIMDKIVTSSSWMPFCNLPNLTTIIFGYNLTTLTSTVFAGDPKLTNVVINSRSVSNISKTIFSDNPQNIEINIYIPFYEVDGHTETVTYKTFKKNGYSSTTRNVQNVKLVDISQYKEG